MATHNIIDKALLLAILAGTLALSSSAHAAGGQIPFARCAVTLRADGFKKIVGYSNLTTTMAWYKAHGYQQTLKATLQQNLYPMLSAKLGKGTYKATCNKTL